MRYLIDPPTPTHTVIQLSDPHIVPEGELYHGVVDTLGNVAAALDQVERSGIEVAALLLTGDLVDAGDEVSYRRLRALVEERAARIGAPVLYLMGNHDSRGALRAALLDAEPTTEPYDYVRWVDGLRIVALDSTEPGQAAGLLTDAQLDWLAAELATPAPAGTVLALHHPPVPSPVGLMNALALAEPHRLARVVAGTDVKIVLAGHAHHGCCGMLAGIPVWVAGATSYVSGVLGPAGGYTGLTGGVFTRVDVYPDQATASVLPVRPGELVIELTPQMLAMPAEPVGAAPDR
ncbi:metallophosphoesterase [Frankia sp. CNm7]|uniref:Metallophosphoesterase n=1 Tax=Frankia nepalensis TaxID=1836974 RepID=A0A937R8S9_9ACTN|nr:metallophosphoesterase [Frankia nepalensis]MBL7500457.1 metallophosphoesterase [Frankia nepalensis]MBL7511182.1 metallophosphoesterase [Frankia nepalensis]MBL7524449.1 metallophosphoesterase [Frankia nepalensis]MBL7627783.1 metallophosphoesterase [Frankia nepalensis]